MKAWTVILLVLLAAGASAAGGYWWGHRHAAAAGEEAVPEAAKPDEKPTATVSVAPLHRAAMSRKIVAYGTVIAPPAEVRVVSVPFECRATRILVAPGDAVTVDQPLIEIEASPATALAFEEAKNAAATADHDLQLVKQRYDQKLATNTELSAAQSAQRLAQGRLQSLQQAGAGGARQLTAESAGVVGKVDVQIGQVVPIGGPLIELTPLKQIQVKLGAEPADVKYLKPGQAVSLHGIDQTDAGEISGTIHTLAQRVDATSRLVDVTVTLPAETKFLLDEFVAGEITLPPAEGFYVPREAVLPDEANQYTLFTVKDGVAVKHKVQIGIEADQMVQVTGEGLKEGDPVVIVGNFELDDGMKVQTQPWTVPESAFASTEPSATEPAQTQQAATEPDSTKAATSEPATTQPAAPAPAAAKPAAPAPATSAEGSK